MSAITIQPVGQLADGVRTAIEEHADWATTAQLVAEQLRAHLPGPDILTPEQRLGSPDRAAGHTLHVEPDLIGHTTGTVGDVNGFAPPGDIHRVHNTSDEVTITLHIYGTDVTRVGSSVRRYYDLPAER